MEARRGAGGRAGGGRLVRDVVASLRVHVRAERGHGLCRRLPALNVLLPPPCAWRRRVGVARPRGAGGRARARDQGARGRLRPAPPSSGGRGGRREGDRSVGKAGWTGGARAFRNPRDSLLVREGRVLDGESAMPRSHLGVRPRLAPGLVRAGGDAPESVLPAGVRLAVARGRSALGVRSTPHSCLAPGGPRGLDGRGKARGGPAAGQVRLGRLGPGGGERRSLLATRAVSDAATVHGSGDRAGGDPAGAAVRPFHGLEARRDRAARRPPVHIAILAVHAGDDPPGTFRRSRARHRR